MSKRALGKCVLQRVITFCSTDLPKEHSDIILSVDRYFVVSAYVIV